MKRFTRSQRIARIEEEEERDHVYGLLALAPCRFVKAEALGCSIAILVTKTFQ